jgi:xanthine/uracil permease
VLVNDVIIAGVTGVCLLVIGVSFLRWNVREWREAKNNSTLDDQDRHHYHARYRRRSQTSTMLIVLGVLIPATLWTMNHGDPAVATAMLVALVLLTGWVILLALGDMLATRTYSRVALAKVRQKQRELERRIVELKNRRGNGQQDP